MTNNKRFTLREPKIDNDIGCEEIADNGQWITYGEIVDLLNELNDENQHFKEALKELKEIGDYQAMRIQELTDMNLGSSADNVSEVIYQTYLRYTNFYDDLTRSEKLLVANFSDFLIESLFESLKEMETEE